MKNFTEFNKQASQYAIFRPSYPRELFDYIKNICNEKKIAFDVGTGTGQCAVDLAIDFEKVYASDLSAEQIANANLNDKITYFIAPAHESGLLNESVDLMTIATAIHWFDLNLFFAEAKRILKPNGVIAFWAYGWHECENSEVTQIFNKIGQDILLPYWSEPPKLIWTGYKTIPFPFEEIKVPEFEILTDWNLAQFIGYISTWSATQKFIDKLGYHPAQQFYEQLIKAWGDPEKTLRFRSSLYLRIGRKDTFCMGDSNG